jgi:hypothetical protein
LCSFRCRHVVQDKRCNRNDGRDLQCYRNGIEKSLDLASLRQQ